MSEISKISKWYIYDHLETDRKIAGYLASRLNDEPVLLASAISDAATALKINAEAKKTRTPRESLYPKDYDERMAAVRANYNGKKIAPPRDELVAAAVNMIREMGFSLSVISASGRKKAAAGKPARKISRKPAPKGASAAGITRGSARRAAA